MQGTLLGNVSRTVRMSSNLTALTESSDHKKTVATDTSAKLVPPAGLTPNNQMVGMFYATRWFCPDYETVAQM